MIPFHCDACGHEGEAFESRRGGEIRCPMCKASVTLPEVPALPPEDVTGKTLQEIAASLTKIEDHAGETERHARSVAQALWCLVILVAAPLILWVFLFLITAGTW